MVKLYMIQKSQVIEIAKQKNNFAKQDLLTMETSSEKQIKI